MSRLDLARALLLLTGIVGGAIILFAVILHREQRKRSGWSTRTRMARSHWSIDLKNRLTGLGENIFTRRPKARKRKTKQRL